MARASASRVFAILAFLILSWAAGNAAAAPRVPVPLMTIVIYNNSTAYGLYPVLSVGQGGPSAPDQWMQAHFGVTGPNLGTSLYPRTSLYRIYITPTGAGIPPGGSITLTLPLYTQLVPTIDPTKGGQLIDWWQGGGIRLFQSLAITGKPPPALTRDYSNQALRPNQLPVSPVAGAAVPTCVTSAGTACQIAMFQDASELGLGDPFQLTEYTLGAVDTSRTPFVLNVQNVDYDVSYVDSIFSPVLMEPYPNAKKIWGWVGIDMKLAPFQAILLKFLANYPQWPTFVDNGGNATLKIPSPLNLFIGNEINTGLNTPYPRPDLTPLPWGPIQTLVDNWRACTPSCGARTDIAAMLQANYTSYTQNYASQASWSCDPKQSPISFTDTQRLGHLYGWSPYNTYCAATANQLFQTPGYFTPGDPPLPVKYRAVKSEYDTLQLIEAFDPYVTLIHGAKYLNAKYAYAYSVDDAVGNVEVDGATGLILAVGGTNGLPNPNPLGNLINVNYGYASVNKVGFVKYGLCTTTPDTPVKPTFASFVAPGYNASQCPISFIDNLGQQYHFSITTLPPYALTQSHSMIDCSGNDANGNLWCANITGYSPVGPNGQTVNYVIAPAPPQPPSRGGGQGCDFDPRPKGFRDLRGIGCHPMNNSPR